MPGNLTRHGVGSVRSARKDDRSLADPIGETPRLAWSGSGYYLRRSRCLIFSTFCRFGLRTPLEPYRRGLPHPLQSVAVAVFTLSVVALAGGGSHLGAKRQFGVPHPLGKRENLLGARAQFIDGAQGSQRPVLLFM